MESNMQWQVLVVKAKSFISELESQGLPIDESTFISAGYDPPFRLTGRCGGGHFSGCIQLAPSVPAYLKDDLAALSSTVAESG